MFILSINQKPNPKKEKGAIMDLLNHCFTFGAGYAFLSNHQTLNKFFLGVNYYCLVIVALWALLFILCMIIDWSRNGGIKWKILLTQVAETISHLLTDGDCTYHIFRVILLILFPAIPIMLYICLFFFFTLAYDARFE